MSNSDDADAENLAAFFQARCDGCGVGYRSKRVGSVFLDTCMVRVLAGTYHLYGFDLLLRCFVD